VGKGNFKLPSEDENSEKKMKKLKKMYKPLTSYWEKEFPSLQSVSISDRLDKEPVVIVTSEYGTSATMEKLQKAQAYGMNKEQMMMQAQMNKKILEINPAHPLIKQLLAKVEDKKQDNPEAKLEEDFSDMLSLLT
jgi:HSP90 family molecular chaperone